MSKTPAPVLAMMGARLTREEVLTALRAHHPHAITVRQISPSVGVSHSAIRAHLRALIDEGLVEYAGQENSRGFPTLYRLPSEVSA